MQVGAGTNPDIDIPLGVASNGQAPDDGQASDDGWDPRDPHLYPSAPGYRPTPGGNGVASTGRHDHPAASDAP